MTAAPPDALLDSADASEIATRRPNAPAATENPSHREPLVIEPAGRFPKLGAKELWSYRGLLIFLVWRDLKVRYAQTVLGAGWAIIQPVLTMVIFTVVFGRFAKVPSDGVPYPVFSLAALVPWTYFATAFAGASNSLVASTNLITKIYFPRLVIPFAPVVGSLVDFLIAFVILLATMAFYHIAPSMSAVLLVPLLVAAMVLTSAGVGCWLAALNIKYRDIKYVVPFLVQIWLYASPVAYPMSVVPARFRVLYAINPMAGVIEGFRSVLLHTSAVPWPMIGFSLLSGVVLFVTGVYYFRATERVFADVA